MSVNQWQQTRRRLAFRSGIRAQAQSIVGPALLVLALVLPSLAQAGKVEVNTCGQAFSGRGFLAADLDCSGFPDAAVTIQRGSLDLRGFTLTPGVGGVFCERSCKVVSDPPGGVISNGVGGGVGSGPPFTDDRRVNIRVFGIIIDTTSYGVFTGRGRIVLVDSTISNSVYDGILLGSADSVRLKGSSITNSGGNGIQGSRVKLFDSDVTGSGEYGVQGSRKATFKRSTVTGSGLGGVSVSGPIRLEDMSVTGNGGFGVRTFFSSTRPGTARIRTSDISANGDEGVVVEHRKLIVKDSTVTNNGRHGIFQTGEQSVKISGSTITGNGIHGVEQLWVAGECRLTVSSSTVTGNGLDLSCGVSQTCADIAACSMPDVTGTTCDTSYDLNSGFPGTNWSVCSLD